MFKKISKSKRHYLLFLPVIAFALVGGFLALEKTGVTDFYTKSTPSTETTTSQQFDEVANAEPTNLVDYGPTKPEDTANVPDKNLNQDTTPTPVNLELGATITSTRPNSANTSYLIKVAVVGTDSGSCQATMTKGSKVLTSSTSITLSAGQYSCSNLEFPLSGLDESGEWNVTVNITDKTGATYSTNTEVIL